MLISSGVKLELTNLLKNRGKLDAGIVVAQAEKKGSALHKHFEWDDTSASKLYREGQADDILLEVYKVRIVYKSDVDKPKKRTLLVKKIQKPMSPQNFQQKLAQYEPNSGEMEIAERIINICDLGKLSYPKIREDLLRIKKIAEQMLGALV